MASRKSGPIGQGLLIYVDGFMPPHSGVQDISKMEPNIGQLGALCEDVPVEGNGLIPFSNSVKQVGQLEGFLPSIGMSFRVFEQSPNPGALSGWLAVEDQAVIQLYVGAQDNPD